MRLSLPQPTLGLVFGDYTAGAESINQRMMKRVKNIAKLCGPEPRMLDVGCGSEQLIQFANDNGWQAYGTELHGQSSDEEIFSIDICNEEILGHPQASFYLVHYYHVLEHLNFFSHPRCQYLMGTLPGFATTYLRTPFIGYGYSFAHAFFDRFQLLIDQGAVIEFLAQKSPDSIY